MDLAVAALFALVAGAGTAFSPCVLPVLPLALSGVATGGRRRPAGIALGLGLSFALVVLLFTYAIEALGLPDDVLRDASIVALLVFGVCLIVPPLAARLEAWLTRLVPQRSAARAGDGFGSGFLLGLSLGPLYLPCAGPILAPVLVASASQDLNAQRVLIGIAYAVGTAAGILLVLLAGRRLLARLRSNAGRFQQAMGVIMVLFALLTAAGLDRDFQTEIDSALPSWLVSPTEGIETSGAVNRTLGVEAKPSGLQDAGPAPEFVDTQKWFNSKPLTLAGLRGRVVLIDFWTYTCINCIRTQPYLNAWHSRYADDGLTIVGVHSPEFPFERDADNVERAVDDADIEYAVAQDNNFGTWNAWGNQYWPAKYLVDARGHVRYAHFGEGDYDEIERVIQLLLREAGRTSDPDGGPATVRAQRPSQNTRTPETYLGTARAQGWLQQQKIRPGTFDFGEQPADVDFNRFSYGGIWTLDPHGAEAGEHASITARFVARRVFLVMGGKGTVDVLLDGRPTKRVRVTEQDIYTLVDLPEVGMHHLELRFDSGVSGYAFTFG